MLLVRISAFSASILILSALTADPLAEELSEDVRYALQEISPERLRAHVDFLADDLLEGRQPGTRGYQLASKYVASHFRQFGLKPAGERDTFFQPVPLRKTTVLKRAGELSITSRGKTLAFVRDDEYLLEGSFEHSEAEVTAPIVFLGYGVTCVEQNHDDYAEID